MSRKLALKNTIPNERDEMYTPAILAESIIPFLEEYVSCKDIDITVWCPFDTEESEIVKACRKVCKVVCSHIATGQDFFDYEPDKWDIAISNPPFSIKLEVFKRLNELGKPYAMLMNYMCLGYQNVSGYFTDNPIQMIVVDKKVSFDGRTSSFSTWWFCKDFCENDVNFVHLEHNNSNALFVPSEMMCNNCKHKCSENKKGLFCIKKRYPAYLGKVK